MLQEKNRRYQCAVCGYVYDPAQGEPKAHIDVGIPWNAVGAGFRCPVCGQGKSAFQAICTPGYPEKSGGWQTNG